jgi:hypothetical protein
LLSRANQLHPTDASTIDQLSRIKYNLVSYRLVFGSSASFDSSSRWIDFVADQSATVIYFDFIGLIYF